MILSTSEGLSAAGLPHPDSLRAVGGGVGRGGLVHCTDWSFLVWGVFSTPWHPSDRSNLRYKRNEAGTVLFASFPASSGSQRQLLKLPARILECERKNVSPARLIHSRESGRQS